MIKFRWEKTAYGYKAWAKTPGYKSYVYLGYFCTKRAALDAFYAEHFGV
jgi:hypothetical protein